MGYIWGRLGKPSVETYGRDSAFTELQAVPVLAPVYFSVFLSAVCFSVVTCV